MLPVGSGEKKRELRYKKTRKRAKRQRWCRDKQQLMDAEAWLWSHDPAVGVGGAKSTYSSSATSPPGIDFLTLCMLTCSQSQQLQALAPPPPSCMNEWSWWLKKQKSVYLVTRRLGGKSGLRARQRESFLLALRGLCRKQYSVLWGEEQEQKIKNSRAERFWRSNSSSGSTDKGFVFKSLLSF